MHLVSFERLPAGSAAEAHAERWSTEAVGFDAVEVGRPGVHRIGALLREGERAGDVVDLNRALATMLALDDVGAPEAEADSLLPADPMAFLRRLETGLPAARRALAFALAALSRYDGPDLEHSGVVEARSRVHLGPPVPRPGKILAVARNYPAHAEERGGGAPSGDPVLFLKAPSSVIGPGEEILLPRASEAVDYEGELAAVIGRAAREVSPERALDHVAGYTVANDVTARDFQHRGGQHFIGKSCDTFCPLGPALVTADAVGDPQDLGLRTRLSGEGVQDGRTKEMTHPVAAILAFASSLMTLEPGDVVLTGTPAGVGAARTPPRYLRDGDVVEVEVERVGCLRNPVRAGNPSSRP